MFWFKKRQKIQEDQVEEKTGEQAYALEVPDEEESGVKEEPAAPVESESAEPAAPESAVPSEPESAPAEPESAPVEPEPTEPEQAEPEPEESDEPDYTEAAFIEPEEAESEETEELDYTVAAFIESEEPEAEATVEPEPVSEEPVSEEPAPAEPDPASAPAPEEAASAWFSAPLPEELEESAVTEELAPADLAEPAPAETEPATVPTPVPTAQEQTPPPAQDQAPAVGPAPVPAAVPTPAPRPTPPPGPAGSGPGPTPAGPAPGPAGPTPRPVAQAVPRRYEPTQEEIDARLPAREPEPKHGHFIGFLIFLLIAAIGGAYYYGKTYAEEHFIHGTYINGENVSNMTVEEAEQIFEKKVANYHVDITFRGGETETIRGSEFSYHSAPDGSLNQIMANQDPYWWFLGFFQKSEAQIPENKTFDQELLRQAVLALPELQESNMVMPTDAYVVYQNEGYTIVPHTEGSLIDTELVAQNVLETVNAEGLSVDVESLGAYAHPEVRSDDEELVAYCDQLNTWIAGSITYYLPDGDEMTLDGSTVKEWLSTDDDGKLYKDDDVFEEKIEIFVDNLAMKVNTVGESRTFKTTNAGSITMNGGDYGYSVNKPAERKAIAELLEEGESDDREPMYYTKEYGDDHSINDGIGDTYIEANLSSQHVWIYIDGRMVCETDCVSGNVNLGRGTPTGIFQILYKDTDVDLKGQQLANGQYSYISHVDYWMPFYSGCGFHDANWRTKFGGTIYKSDGSHGCINLPVSITPTFYSYVQKGMPVVVYY